MWAIYEQPGPIRLGHLPPEAYIPLYTQTQTQTHTHTHTHTHTAYVYGHVIVRNCVKLL